MLGHATAKYLRISPRKVRLLTRMIQGMGVTEADALLGQTNKGATVSVRRVLKTAAAAANQKAQVEPQDLVIVKAVADGAGMWKRQRASAMGRAGTIRKRLCHVRIEVDAKPNKALAGGK